MRLNRFSPASDLRQSQPLSTPAPTPTPTPTPSRVFTGQGDRVDLSNPLRADAEASIQHSQTLRALQRQIGPTQGPLPASAGLQAARSFESPNCFSRPIR